MSGLNYRVLVAAYVTCAGICTATVVPPKAEIMYNEKKTSECSIEELVDFIDQSLAQPRINASEFDSQFLKLRPACPVDVSHAEEIARKSRFLESISRGGSYNRWLTFLFRTRVSGQNFTAQFSIDTNTGEVGYLSGGHHSL